MLGSLVLVGASDWTTICDFFPNLETVYFGSFEINLDRKEAHSIDDYNVLSRTVTITNPGYRVPADIHTIGTPGSGLVRSIVTWGETNPSWVPEHAWFQIPGLFFLPLKEMFVHAPFSVSLLWLEILQYRHAARIPIAKMTWRLEPSLEDLHLVARAAPPGLRCLSLVVHSNYMPDWTLAAIMSRIDTSFFPTLEVLKLHVSFFDSVCVRSEGVNSEVFAEMNWADVALPDGLHITLSLTISTHFQDPPAASEYHYEERMFEALPVEWLGKVRQSLEKIASITVGTFRQSDGEAVWCSSPSVHNRLQEVLTGPTSALDTTESSTPGAASGVGGELDTQLSELHL